jgi:hypothetical protein
MNTEQAPAEAKRNHLWRHTVWQTDPELHPLGPRHSAEVYCCEESNGFAVWYVRRLPHVDARSQKTAEPGLASLPSGIDNGDYLLAYVGRDRRDEAIMHAVLVATGAGSPEMQIAALDALAGKVARL